MLRRSFNPLQIIPRGVASTAEIEQRLHSLRNIKPLDKLMFAQYYIDGKTVNSIQDVKRAGCQSVILIAHGLLGSSRTWHKVATKFGSDLVAANKETSSSPRVALAAVDLRNHGNTSHSPLQSMDAMCTDLEHFVKKLKAELGENENNNDNLSLGLLAHSMAGALAITLMSWCRKDPSLFPTIAESLKASLIVDLSPGFDGNMVYGDVKELFTAMEAVAEEKAKRRDKTSSAPILSRAEADTLMKENLPHVPSSMRAFALTNFVEETGGWRCNFPVLCEKAKSKALFLEHSPIVHFASTEKISVPSLFVFGEQSPYNNENERREIPDLFETVEQIEVKDASHYVHIEKLETFSNIAVDFFKKNGF